ncbi:MAG: malate dehydrogenase [Nitrososphaerota archaeon]|jgi:malate dehydrogenase|nr:malate dehydrogenase [Nitrososphaerota archaeon]MDG6913416.1 malate dehydrogenase [Nitrososphaerota archaeon]MDG6937170.1 malate dehydrogenase [Nitrososphaerota archaeon]MDG6957118.1 malate dehydrogenase [Nitrososphaerota archaeon]MDG6961815.1 malate dehydrogenase [Nitrososphaerota archaeon]
MIGVAGAGRIGAQSALEIASMGLDDVALVDIVPGLAEGEALDISHKLSDLGVDVDVAGSTDYSVLDRASLVVIAAGMGRKPGMTRMDLLAKNASIVAPVTREVAKHAPDSVLLVMTNPMDVLTYAALKASGFPKGRVVGQGGLLDNSRFKYVLAKKLGVSRGSISSLVIGEHGENMIPLASHTYVSGVPLTTLLDEEEIQQAIDDTRKVAADVISKKGATVFAPGRVVARMAKAIVDDTKEVLPASAYLEGEYGVSGICMGVPLRLGAGGIEKIYELKLTDKERDWFNKGADTVREAIATLKVAD